eukprot:77623_1
MIMKSILSRYRFRGLIRPVYPKFSDQLQTSLQQFRSFAKKKKLQRGIDRDADQARRDQVAEDFTLSGFQTDMEKSVARLQEELKSIRTGRPVPAMIEDIKVEPYEGVISRLKEVGTITIRSNNALAVHLADPEVLPRVKIALENCGRNLNPHKEGPYLVVPVPRTTADFRGAQKTRAKALHHEALIALQKHQQVISKKLQRIRKDIPTDDFHATQNEIRTEFGIRSKKIDAILTVKQNEL